MSAAVTTGAPEPAVVAPVRVLPLAVARIAIGGLVLLRTTPVLAPLRIPFLGDATPLLGWPEPGFSFAWLPLGVIAVLCVLRTLGAVALTIGLWTAPAGILLAGSGLLVAAQSPFGAPATLQLLYEAAALLGLSDASTAPRSSSPPGRSSCGHEHGDGRSLPPSRSICRSK